MARWNRPADVASRIVMLMVGVAVSLVGGVFVADAQQKGSLPRIGLITLLSEAAAEVASTHSKERCVSSGISKNPP
jgi:hypothetical protein